MEFFEFTGEESIIKEVELTYKYPLFYKEKIEITKYPQNFPIEFLPLLVNDKILKYIRIIASNSKNFREVHKQIKNKDYKLNPHNRNRILYNLFIKKLTQRRFINLETNYVIKN